MIRTEEDFLGKKNIQNEHLYGIHTIRAIENFGSPGRNIASHKEFIKAFATVKKAAACANHDSGNLDLKTYKAIKKACEEIENGMHYDHFVVDLIQGGAGTSTNMNVNEVIANRALELLGHQRGDYLNCHPNNHVNMSQSTNDVYPTALKLSIIWYTESLMGKLRELIQQLKMKSSEFSNIMKVGRTQLQDAVPMTLGQTFGAFATTLSEELLTLDANSKLFHEVNLGGTAIGTGLNASLKYRESVLQYLVEFSKVPFVRADNLVESTQDTGAFIMFSSVLKRLAIKLSKICNDLRLLSSGPRAGFNEIDLPPVQAGSSIMPGKVNPVIPEMVNQVAFKVMGNDLTVNLACEAGQLELNAFEPIMAESIFESMHLLMGGISSLNEKCVKGITANSEVCSKMFNESISIVTALVPKLGYERCSKLAQKALLEKKTIAQVIREESLMSETEVEQCLLPSALMGT